MGKPQNVMLLIADDWSPLAGCYGTAKIHTPNIDALAQRGTVFTNAFCTSPSCAASRANLLTGLYSHTHGQYGHCHYPHGFRTHERVQSLPAVLKSAGLFSGLVGKSHIAPPSVYPFDFWLESDGTPWPAFSANWLATQAETFFSRAEGRPFFLHAASMHPHRVYQDRADGGFDLHVHGAEYAATDVRYSPQDVLVPDFLPDTPTVRGDLSSYWTSVTRFDTFVGKMIQALQRSGRAGNTLVILLSDHGMPFPGAKASPFEAGHRCPLIVVDPTGSSQQCEALVNWCDVMPTVLQAMGVPENRWPKELPGKSILPLLGNPRQEFREVTFYSHSFHEITNYFPYRVARDRRHKYVRCYAKDLPLPTDLFDSSSYREIHRSDGAPARSLERLLHHAPFALFDLQNDPHERENLIDRAEFAPVADRLQGELLAMQQKTQDPWLEEEHQIETTCPRAAVAPKRH